MWLAQRVPSAVNLGGKVEDKDRKYFDSNPHLYIGKVKLTLYLIN
jgi:hypothetical protein